MQTAFYTRESPIEVPYFVAFADPLCFLCGSEVDLVIREDCYSFCSVCNERGYKPRRKSREHSGRLNHNPIDRVCAWAVLHQVVPGPTPENAVTYHNALCLSPLNFV